MDTQQPITYTSLPTSKDKFINYEEYLNQVKRDRKHLFDSKFTIIPWKDYSTLLSEFKQNNVNTSTILSVNDANDIIDLQKTLFGSSDTNAPPGIIPSVGSLLSTTNPSKAYAYFPSDGAYKLIDLIEYIKFEFNTHVTSRGNVNSLIWVIYYLENSVLKFEPVFSHIKYPQDPKQTFDKLSKVFKLNDGAILSEDEKTLLTTVLSNNDFKKSKMYTTVSSALSNMASKASNMASSFFSPKQYGGKSRRIRRTKRSRAKSTRTKRRHRR